MLFYADASEVDELQDTGREQVVVVGTEVFVCVQHVVGLLQVTVEGYIAIPHQTLRHFPSRAPDI
ncbi:hypothetical protein DCD76_19205, partial [Acinetobacter baumannii]